jgi:hypothetical protein
VRASAGLPSVQKFRIVVAMKIYPGALRGLCATLKDNLLPFIKT